MIDESKIAERYRALGPELNERQRRLWAASEARSHGRGGIAAVVRATGISKNSPGFDIAQTGRNRGVRELALGKLDALAAQDEHPAFGDAMRRLARQSGLPDTGFPEDESHRWAARLRLAREANEHLDLRVASDQPWAREPDDHRLILCHRPVLTVGGAQRGEP